MIPADISDVVNIDAARAKWGEPEYKPMKCYLQATGNGGNRRHVRSIEWHEVSEAEYAQEVEDSRRLEVDRFMGRFKGSFWNYERRLVKAGWPQALEKALSEFTRAATK